MPLLAELFEEGLSLGVLMQPGNNIGYFGPYEHRWRVTDAEYGHFQGCTAGHTGLGIEADGTIKGCPSLATADYSGGNVRDMTIEQIWYHSSQLRFTRDRTTEDLWGFCKTCYYADVCRSGCTWTNHTLLGRAGNNPYCHFRALSLAKEGKRERVVKVEDGGRRARQRGRELVRLDRLARSSPSRSRRRAQIVERLDRHARVAERGDAVSRRLARIAARRSSAPGLGMMLVISRIAASSRIPVG